MKIKMGRRSVAGAAAGLMVVGMGAFAAPAMAATAGYQTCTGTTYVTSYADRSGSTAGEIRAYVGDRSAGSLSDPKVTFKSASHANTWKATGPVSGGGAYCLK